MTAKELVIPVTLALSIGGSAVLIANSNGRQAQALLTVQATLASIQSDLKENEQNYRGTIKALAAMEARLAVVEKTANAQNLAVAEAQIEILQKAAELQNGINLRVLAHLERKGD